MSPGEEQHTLPDSTVSEDKTVVDGGPSIGKQHRPYHLLVHNDSISHVNKFILSYF